MRLSGTLVLLTFSPTFLTYNFPFCGNDFPPNLIEFITETKANLCGVSTKLLIFPNESPVYYSLHKILEKSWNVPLVVANDLFKITRNYLGIDCAIIFGSVFRDVSSEGLTIISCVHL